MAGKYQPNLYGMKILLTTDNIGGVWTFSLNLAKGLKKNGIEVFIVVIGNKMTDYQKEEIDFTSWFFIGSKQEWMLDPWNDIKRSGKLLSDIVASVRPDILHLNSYSLARLQWCMPVIVTAHSCVLSWWEAVKHEQAPAEWNRYREMVGQGIRTADVIVAPSASMMNAIEQHYAPEKIKAVIYNGSDKSAFSSAPRQKFVFSLGRLWDEAKNVKLLIEAAGEIGYHIFVAGDLNGKNTGILPKNVHLLGRLTARQVAGWLSEAAIYVLPVIYEPFGYTFLEAALSGCALIAGDIESMREIWPGAAVLADPYNSRELAREVNTLMEDSGRRELLASRAFEIATREYTLEKMSDQYIILYNNLLHASESEKLTYQEL